MHARWAVLGIFILSGAAGLIYEIVWARQLVLVFGNTTQAVSAILTGFFGGMAIGSVIGGRFADRVRSPLRLYGIIELALVVIVLATPLTFGLVHEVYRGFYAALEGSPQGLAIVRLVLALVAMGPATILMGVTLPALTRHLTQDAHLSQAFGWLYAANTYGAILGTLAAGLILIELLGLTGALIVGATLSGIAGLIAILLPTHAGRRTTAAGAHVIDRVVAHYPSRPRVALVVAFISGLTSLGYQVLWVRLLSSGTGNSTYVFTIILAIFLLGIALGAMIFNIIRPRLRDPLRLLAGTQIAVAALAIAGLALVLISPRILDPAQPLQTVSTLFISVLLVVLPVTVALGIAFPTSSALLADDEQRSGRHSGQLLAVNTFGAICGSLLIPFFLVPAIGSPHVVAVLAMVNGTLGAILAWLAWRGTALGRVMAVAGAAVVAVAVVAASVPGILVQPNEASILARGGTVFESNEDEIASVQAGQIRSTPELWVAGTSMTLLTIDAKLMPLMPLIARPASEEALIVAFGMGSSYRTALIAGLETEAVELVPSVVDMFGWYYEDAEEYATHPNGRIVVADGRNHLQLSGRQYDIIVTDPPPPIFSSGASVISSLEYYEAGRDHLKPAGVMMQWTPHGATAEAFREHIRTFAAVFPEVLIARGPGGYGNFMLGSMEPMELSRDAIEGVLARPGVLEDLVSAYDSPSDTLDGWATVIDGLTWLNGDEVDAYAGDGPLVTDDRPLPEYFLLRRLAGG